MSSRTALSFRIGGLTLSPATGPWAGLDLPRVELCDTLPHLRLMRPAQRSVGNSALNGGVIRLDGDLRTAPR